MQMRSIVASTVAIITLLGLISGAFFVFDADLSGDEKWRYIGVVWFFSILLSLYIWQSYALPNASAWFACFLIGIPVTGASYLLDCLFGLYFSPGKGFLAGGRTGIGFAFTLLLGCCTAICFAGGVRSFIKSQLDRTA